MARLIILLTAFTGCIFLFSCKKNTKQREEEIYSKHLQEHLKISVISTPPPDDMGKMNLLLVNDGQEFAQFRVKEIVDSLYKNNLIKPLLVVGIHAKYRNSIYGVSGFPDYKKNGDKASYYAGFINNELIDYIKKNAGTRTFESIAMAGCSLGGLSALDIAWDHHEKIDKVGVFSGSFWWRDKDAAAKDYDNEKNRIMLSKIKDSRKKPKLKYWFYTGGNEEESDRDKDGITDVEDDTKDLINQVKSKNVCRPEDILYVQDNNGMHNYNSWSKHLPSFLTWAFGK